MKEIKCRVCGKKYNPSFYVVGNDEFCSKRCLNEHFEFVNIKDFVKEKVKENAKTKIRRNTIKKSESKK